VTFLYFVDIYSVSKNSVNVAASFRFNWFSVFQLVIYAHHVGFNTLANCFLICFTILSNVLDECIFGLNQVIISWNNAFIDGS
jgi:hypothetical protein